MVRAHPGAIPFFPISKTEYILLSAPSDASRSNNGMECTARLRGATVARLTPDQKAACSNHVGVNLIFVFLAAFKLPINLISKCPDLLYRLQRTGSLQHHSFLSVVVITSALHAEGRRFEPGRKQRCLSCSGFLLYPACSEVENIPQKSPVCHPSFLSVVVITSALHA